MKLPAYAVVDKLLLSYITLGLYLGFSIPICIIAISPFLLLHDYFDSKIIFVFWPSWPLAALPVSPGQRVDWYFLLSLFLNAGMYVFFCCVLWLVHPRIFSPARREANMAIYSRKKPPELVIKMLLCLVFASLGAICIYVVQLNPAEQNFQTISQAERLSRGHIVYEFMEHRFTINVRRGRALPGCVIRLWKGETNRPAAHLLDLFPKGIGVLDDKRGNLLSCVRQTAVAGLQDHPAISGCSRANRQPETVDESILVNG